MVYFPIASIAVTCVSGRVHTVPHGGRQEYAGLTNFYNFSLHLFALQDMLAALSSRVLHSKPFTMSADLICAARSDAGVELLLCSSLVVDMLIMVVCADAMLMNVVLVGVFDEMERMW